jgi:nocardicin N-oxygenase
VNSDPFFLLEKRLSMKPECPRDYPFPTSPGLDPDPFYATLRAHQPVAPIRVRDSDGHYRPAWLVTGYHEAKLVLSDRRFSRAQAVARDDNTRRRTVSMADIDGPEHTRLRRTVASAFNAQRTRELQPRITQIVNRCLDDMLTGERPVDLVTQLALPLPITVIGDLLGIPESDRGMFVEWADDFLANSTADPARTRTTRKAFGAYLKDLIAQRKTTPTDDLLGALIHTAGSEPLTDPELINLAAILLIGGYETTANQLTNIVYTLLTHTDTYTRLAADRHQLPSALEELLRYVPLSINAPRPRIATENVHLSGVHIAAGDAVYVARAVASRDHTVWSDGDHLDLDRIQPESHLAFGHGPHYCLGAHLARAELHTALDALLTRIPTLRLAVPPTGLRWKTTVTVVGPRELPVSW